MAAMLLSATSEAPAQKYTVGELEISHPWARASAGRTKNGGAYIEQIINHGSSPDKLVGVSSKVAKKTQIHNHTMEDGVMKMRHVKGVDVMPGHPATLKPGGYHIMLMGLKAPLKKGESFHVILEFEKAGKIEVMVPIMKVGSSGRKKMKMKMNQDSHMKH